MRNIWTHLMVSATFYLVVDDILLCPFKDKVYCPLTIGLLPLDCTWRLAGNVVNNSTYMFNLINNTG